MITVLVNCIMRFIVNESKSEDIYYNDRIRYGLETMLSEGIKMIFLFILSLLLHRMVEFLLITVLIIGVRTKIGGSHCKSFISCFIKTVSLYLILYTISSLIPEIPRLIQGLIVIATLFVIIISKYRTKLEELLDSKKVTKLKIRTSLIYFVIYIITLITDNSIYANVVLLFGIYILYERGELLCLRKKI